MKGCARTCLLWLLGWGAASYAFFVYFRSLGDLGDGLYWAAGGAGLCVVLVVSYLLGIIATARERSVLLESMTGTPPRDGAWVAVSGRIQSLHRLRAPLTGESVVTYTYKIWRMERRGKSSDQVVYFEGKALVPSTIATRHGSVRLLAVPTLDVAPVGLDLATAITHAREYIAATSFVSPADGSQRTGRLESEWTDDDGNYRHDMRRSPDRDIPLEQCELQEVHIRQGETVCAFGLYAQRRGGIVPHPNWAKQMRIMRGDAEAVARQLRSRMFRYLFGVAFFGAALYGIIRLCQYHAVPFE